MKSTTFVPGLNTPPVLRGLALGLAPQVPVPFISNAYLPSQTAKPTRLNGYCPVSVPLDAPDYNTDSHQPVEMLPSGDRIQELTYQTHLLPARPLLGKRRKVCQWQNIR